MQRNNLFILLGVAIVAGIGAGYLAFTQLRPTMPAAMATNTRTTPVVVAQRDLSAGTVLGPQDLKTVQWPRDGVPATYTTSKDEVIGLGLMMPVQADEPILRSKLASKEAGGGLPIVIPEGMRAVSVKVDEVISVAGFVTPDTRVDVIVTYEDENADQPHSKVILQNVRAIAAGQTTERDAEGKPQTVSVITLLVTPDQAETLTLAANEGRIQLALRNALDQEEIETAGASTSKFAGYKPPVAKPGARRPVVRRPSGQTVVTYNGSERTETTFRD